MITVDEAPGLAPHRSKASRRVLRARLYLCLIALDSLCILGSLYLATVLWPPAGDEQWLTIGSMFLPVYLGYAFNAGAYSAQVIEEPLRGVSRSIRALLLAAATVVLIAFSLKTSTSLSRMTLGIGLGLSALLTAVARDAFLRKARSLLGGNPFMVVMITDGAEQLPIDSHAVIVPASAVFDPDYHCPTMYDRLAVTVKDADRVIVACAPDRRASWANALKGASVQSEIVAPELLRLAPLGLGNFGSAPTIVVADGMLSFADTLVKRIFDIVVAGVALIVLAPALLTVAILIRVESAGPALFVQTRIGRGNLMFRMFKFRSMRIDKSDTEGNASTARDDERMTRLGRFIRRTSIDELPQLLNVLLGNMSIVGPRPHALGSRAEDKLFWEIDHRYWHRHAAKPGLTGLAQIRGYRGATLLESDLTDRLQADLEYLNDWSLWKDLMIIMKTFGVLIHKNAY